jgi:hypothetical protein
MKEADPRELATYRVRITSNDAEEAHALSEALLDVPAATDDEVARLLIVSEEAGEEADAHVLLAPMETTRLDVTQKPVFLVRHDLTNAPDEPQCGPRSFVVGPSFEGVDLLRAALLGEALSHLGATVDRARQAKRPFAIAIIASATLVSTAEGVLPGAAAFIVATQVSAIASLYYLYRGKWMGRTQVLTLLPVFASEAAGGSLFLLAKSFLPPTGVGDVAAAIVAASISLAMLGAVASVLEQGYSLDEREKLREAFQRMSAKTKAERAYIARNRHRWNNKTFFRDLVRRLVFD